MSDERVLRDIPVIGRVELLEAEKPEPRSSADRFADVDNVNEVFAGVNVRPHLRIPPTRTVSVVDTCFHQFLN